jgi:hypothetical protein
MKQYIVEVKVGFQTVKKYVAEQLSIAEMIAESVRDDITDAFIREVTL